MVPYQHQLDISRQAYEILRINGLVYLAMEERTGKSLTAILTCELSDLIKNVLIVTKKKALKEETKPFNLAEEGWAGTLNQYYSPCKTYNDFCATWEGKISFTVVNYHSVAKVKNKKYDLVILDEPHSYLSKYPKPGAIWKDVSKYTVETPIIYLDATPNAQSYSLLYHQFKLCAWSPWRKYSNFYTWFEWYGIPRTRFIGGKQFKVYDNVKEELVRRDTQHLFLSYSRQELGFKHEPNDVIHFVKLSDRSKAFYKTLEKDSLLKFGEAEIVAETPMSLMTKLHQIEGGTIKFEDESYILGNTEKIDYIRDNWGDTKDVVIFYHYKEEEKLLKSHFMEARILQATSFAEGVDLSMHEHLVVYSMNFSTAQYTQRRARQANMKRETEINVHFLLVDGAISSQVYKTVAVNKQNFVDKYYERGLL